MPWSRLMPSGGVEVSQESVERWIKAGAACLGVGGSLINPKILAAGQFDSIRNGVSSMLAWIKAARHG
jgi:2-dehydro-3-deoxyphosphogluconate aldolase/(4S)-4-hydroxy-2-oxoglutarate aldolase